MTASSGRPALAARPSSGPTTQVCNQPPRPATPTGFQPLSQNRRSQPAKCSTRRYPAAITDCQLKDHSNRLSAIPVQVAGPVDAINERSFLVRPQAQASAPSRFRAAQ